MNFLRIAVRIANKHTSKIRSKTFNLAEFKKILNQQSLLDYAFKHLKSIGSGSSRFVFALTSTKVLKIADPGWKQGEPGIAQNKTEVDIYTDPKIKPIVTKIFDFDPEYKWIISEAVRPISTRIEFAQLTGCDLQEMVELSKPDSELSEFERARRNYLKETIDKITPKCGRFIEAIRSLMQEGSLLKGDIEYHDHWGKTPDGRVVLLDYGFSKQVNEEYYEERTGDFPRAAV
jgi:hypothetical protein